MRRFDFIFQLGLLIIYVALSPILFSILYPTTGDQSLIWIWVVVTSGITSIISLLIFTLLNLLFDPRKLYWTKGIFPLVLSSFLAFRIGSGLNEDNKAAFLLGNFVILVVLYGIYGLVFHKKIKKSKTY